MGTATLNDEARRATVGGTYNGGLMTYFAANGGTGTTLADLEMSYLASKGFANGSLQDRWMAYLGSLSFSGSLNDRMLAFWRAS